MNSPTPELPYLDVPALLESSRPRQRVNWFWYGAGVFLLISLGAAYLSASSPTGRLIVEGGSVFVTIAIIGGMSAITAVTLKRVRAAQLQIEAAAELVQLRRWPQASAILTQILSQPVRTPAMRFEALLYLATVLARNERFDDAIAVYDHLLESNRMDTNTERAIKLGRAMALLRQDRLVDADRAIGDLRRGEAREISGGLALIEIYRDIKTGHPAEAIELFELRRTLMRDQLGHRVGDAHALVAKAYDLLDQIDAAQRELTNATRLVSIEDLLRRYPELSDLRAKYRTAMLPTIERRTPSPGTPGEGGGEGSAASVEADSQGDRTLTQPSPGVPGEGLAPPLLAEGAP